jgi:hypothetical protein
MLYPYMYPKIIIWYKLYPLDKNLHKKQLEVSSQYGLCIYVVVKKINTRQRQYPFKAWANKIPALFVVRSHIWTIKRTSNKLPFTKKKKKTELKWYLPFILQKRTQLCFIDSNGWNIFRKYLQLSSFYFQKGKKEANKRNFHTKLLKD